MEFTKYDYERFLESETLEMMVEIQSVYGQGISLDTVLSMAVAELFCKEVLGGRERDKENG